ncbi:uncharacterized protein LOC101782153 isoform X2 [Setaria italica]|uniref:uncharacterized protein LOC101782153 isoform X2 n=1 Tax=Setaria italica TaxID=4555 RepID=UPI000BE612AB|nr:uncharacterized protein LOC101782153 isoform X2 [Setaria italica]
MLPSKRGADDLTRFSADNKRTCSGEEATDFLDIWRDLGVEVASKVSRSVVSIGLSDGQNVLYASSGVVIECQSSFTKFVTSASLVRALHDSETNDHTVKIVVRHEEDVAIGFLEEYDLDYEIAVVKVKAILDVYCVPLDHQVMQGGALYDFYGNFFGINLFWDMERPIFLPRSIILERVVHFRTSLKKSVFLNLVKPVRDKKRQIRRIGVKLLPRPEGSIKIFGDVYPNGVWSELEHGVVSHILRNLVALASFKGESKLRTCTGFFIDYADKCPTILTSASLVRKNDAKIIEGLRIVVLLPNRERCEGKLEHYSLHYNVALVSIKNYTVDCPVDLNREHIDWSTKLLAVGRCFESGLAMAASGKCTRWSGNLDCKDLQYTACTITKAGIGGPLVAVNGKFVGMNYYDRNMGTPFLWFDLLRGILNYFKTGQTNYMKILHDSSVLICEVGCIVKDGEQQPPNRRSEDKILEDQDEDASKDERAAIAHPNRYWYRNGNLSVYK